MSPGSPVWTAAGTLAALLAAAALLRRGRRGGPSAFRWLAAVSLAWGAAFVAQVAATQPTVPAFQFSFGDLLALLGLPPLVIGLARLGRAERRLAGRGWVADGAVLAASAFGVSWVALLRSAYDSADAGTGSFAVGLIHPLADLVVLGATLAVAMRAGRAGLLAYLALATATLGDLLADHARAVGVQPGSWTQLAWLAAICLLGAAGLARAGPAAGKRSHRPAEAGLRAVPGGPAGRLGATAGRLWSAQPGAVVCLTSATVAMLVTLIFAAVTWGRSGPVPLVVACVLILALVGRSASLLLRLTAASDAAEVSGGKFGLLAERTSDVVLLCDRAGVVTYASGAVAQYGYEPGQLAGRWLADLVHPDGWESAVRAVAGALSSQPARSARVACQVRAADGTWRDVQATMSRYTGDALLVTVRDLSDQVALRRQLTHLTFHDGLTGLPNRVYLEERAKDLLSRQPARDDSGRPERRGAIFIDLDGFTAINDSVGHGAGDLLLAQVARRLRDLVPGHDTVARWGGDEFAVLIEQPATPQEIVDIADRVVAAIAADPFEVADRDVPMTGAVGVAFADPDVGEHLLRNADLAMARAKADGGNRVELFAAHMHSDVIRRLELAADLREAIAGGGLQIEYLPLIELSTSRVTGVEALVRWRRGGEQVPAAELLGIAEQSGLIVALGDRVLREACRQVAGWQSAGWPVGLSVNCSFRQLSGSQFAESVLAALDDCGLSHSALTLEVTERVLIEAGDRVIGELSRLRARGVRLAIDNFGTGYASLAYLRELPVDIIKIDPSFVAALGHDGILAMLTRTIVQVGHDLGIEIVAEGIERPEQLELLRAMGCGLGQGFLLAGPMTAHGVETLRGGPGAPGHGLRGPSAAASTAAPAG